MRSVYTKILLWCLATLVLSMTAFVVVSRGVYLRWIGKNSFFDRMNVFVLKEARAAYERDGRAGVAAYLKGSIETLGGEQHLLDRNGVDLATGKDMSRIASQYRFEKGGFQSVNGRGGAGVASRDGAYRFLVLVNPPFPIKNYIPYYFAILVAVGVLCWAMAYRIATPLRQLASTVERFGRGDLALRVNSRRRDEIGDLGAAFDRMAERISALLTSERRLLQDISHELRTPLARLSFAAELVRLTDDREAAAATLKKEVQRLTDLVGALIEATRAEGDPSSVRLEELHLDEILDDIVQDCRLEASARGCQIAVAADANVLIEGTRELLRRAIENVLRNAIRYTPEGSAVEVSLDTTAEHARISVRDYGPGVPDEAIEKIFQPFFRIDDSRTSSTGGVGLGLTIAQRAVSLHDGYLKAENVNPGLRVTLEIPLASAGIATKSLSASS